MRAPEKTFVSARELRKDMSLPEVILWDCLRSGRLNGLRFRRQHAIGPYVIDFYCAPAKLAIEVDGSQHDHPGQLFHDRRRDSWLISKGIRVMRFAATDILNDNALGGVLGMIAEAADTQLMPPPPPSAVPLPRFAGEDQS